jgi:hypothetical protein
MDFGNSEGPDGWASDQHQAWIILQKWEKKMVVIDGGRSDQGSGRWSRQNPPQRVLSGR